MASLQCCRPGDQNCHQGHHQQHSGSFGQIFKPQGGYNNHNYSGSMPPSQTQCYPQTHQGQHMNHNHSMTKPANSYGPGYGYGNGPAHGQNTNHGMGMGTTQPHFTGQTNGGHHQGPQGHGYGYAAGTAACHGKTHRRSEHKRRGLFGRLKDGISGGDSSSDSESDSDDEGCRRHRC